MRKAQVRVERVEFDDPPKLAKAALNGEEGTLLGCESKFEALSKCSATSFEVEKQVLRSVLGIIQAISCAFFANFSVLTMATCLFTNVELGPDTREEHTIPRSMGGRLTSKVVSSNDFNNDCGSFCDDKLQKVYAFILLRLSPLLPSASQPGIIRAISGGTPDGLVIEPGGIPARRGVTVVERDDTGRPKKILGGDEESVRRFAKKVGMPELAKISMEPLTKNEILTMHLPVFGAEMELAAVKCLLLTFDHILQDKADRFTRSENLRHVRDAVRESVYKKHVEGALLAETSLGIQLEKLPLYGALREAMKVEHTPFEHYMFAAGSAAHRCIDAVWIVFGFEPFGFRLSHRYDGGDFCYGFVNPIVKERRASEAIELGPLDELLCRPTKRRTVHPGGDFSKINDTCAELVLEIMPRRTEAFDRAVYVVNTAPECRDWVVERLREMRLGESEYIRALLERRLWNLYPHLHGSPDFKTSIRHALESNQPLAQGASSEESVSSVDQHNSWDPWLSVYRGALDDLRRSHGLPGGGYWRDTQIRNDAETWKSLGVKDPV